MTGARRSHPPTLLKLVERTLKTECHLPAGARLLIGVSGGGDSQALLHVLARLSARLKFTVHAHGVDHGLRPEARAELDLAEALADREGVAFRRSRVALAPGGNLMARARKARSQALERAAAAVGAGFIATAHHADDRAETVLLRLLRGAGPRGLAVLPALAGARLRPMVRARRTDVQAHLARHRLDYCDDPTNRDPRFLRSRVRHELLPLLEALSPKIGEHLVALADQLAEPGSPTLRGPDGADIPLGRAQARALTRMLEGRDPRAEIWLPGGRLARFDPAVGGPRVVAASASGAAIRRKSD